MDIDCQIRFTYVAGVEEDRTFTEPIPVDALGDHKLVQRVNTWPKENRPFWLINAEQIERHRNTKPGVGIIRPSGNGVTATTNTEDQAQKAGVQLDQQRDIEVDQEEALSNQRQRRFRPSDVAARREGGHGRGSRALFTPEEVLWDSRASRVGNRNY
ncbi:unnamed protein product [Callosobruchus maculatus]|uniref:Uncharacterized protein n=1 Tax=Callosobruchus maculatus TaxID=64391 RepID=A0A653CPX4_CALMS|nr:unnamed protein product [Callosobruchus maculatus]